MVSIPLHTVTPPKTAVRPRPTKKTPGGSPDFFSFSDAWSVSAGCAVPAGSPGVTGSGPAAFSMAGAGTVILFDPPAVAVTSALLCRLFAQPATTEWDPGPRERTALS